LLTVQSRVAAKLQPQPLFKGYIKNAEMVREVTEVTCAIIRQGDKIAVVQRSASMPHPLKWEFPGGKIRTGESPEKCIRREIREELQIEVKVEAMLPTVVHAYGDKVIRLIPFVCSILSGEIKLSEHMDLRWLTDNELIKADLLDADKMILPLLVRRGRAA